LSLASITPANAAVVYSFEAYSSSGLNISGSFVYTSSDFISTNITVPVSNLDSCVVTTGPVGTCGVQQFFADTSGISGNGDIYDAIAFGLSNGDGAYYYFDNNVFGAAGEYDTVLFGTDQQGHLSVTVSSVPLPATFWLFGSGLLGLIGVARRKAA